ncbi:MAG TPA: manganese catalase family protein [Acetobacteraceae bacterium]|nr:manganese catalase family protein [Acetobacteraceae bacterium]
MFVRHKETMMPAEAKHPDPRNRRHLLEQFGGATGESTAALTGRVQSFHVAGPGIRRQFRGVSDAAWFAISEMDRLSIEFAARLKW